MSNENNEYSLSASTIGQIAKVLQVAILTGTDIVDNLKMMKLTVSDEGTLDPSEGYVDTFNDNIERMMSEVSDDNASEELVDE
jgi:hypothetical protein